MFFYETDKGAEETAEEVFSVLERGILAPIKNDSIDGRENP
jgi:hypothetical protein